MRWRPVLVDGAAAVVAFGLSTAVLATTDEPVAAGLRELSAVAFVLLAVYSASIVARRRSPELAVFGGFLAGVWPTPPRRSRRRSRPSRCCRCTRRAGVTIVLTVEGDRPNVPPGVDLTASRIVREALTNVVKHAGGANATVAIRYSADAVTIQVDDDGPGPRPGTTSGYGLAGMRERVAIYDDDITAGTKPAGGFRAPPRCPSESGRDHLRRRGRRPAADPRRPCAPLIDNAPDLELAGEAGDGEQAVELARRHRPDVLLMDTGCRARRHRGDEAHHRGRRPRRNARRRADDLRQRRLRARRHPCRGQWPSPEGRFARERAPRPAPTTSVTRRRSATS